MLSETLDPATQKQGDFKQCVGHQTTFLVDIAEHARQQGHELRKGRAHPQLSVIALELLSIPAMSADEERVVNRYGACPVPHNTAYANIKWFRRAKLLIADHRVNLKEESIEANECLRLWELAGAATVKDGLLPVWTT
jgi:hypothetical protein